MRITGHGDYVKQFKFSRDGKQLASWAPRRGWKIWSTKTGQLLRELPETPKSRDPFPDQGNARGDSAPKADADNTPSANPKGPESKQK